MRLNFIAFFYFENFRFSSKRFSVDTRTHSVTHAHNELEIPIEMNLIKGLARLNMIKNKNDFYYNNINKETRKTTYLKLS